MDRRTSLEVLWHRHINVPLAQSHMQYAVCLIQNGIADMPSPEAPIPHHETIYFRDWTSVNIQHDVGQEGLSDRKSDIINFLHAGFRTFY